MAPVAKREVVVKREFTCQLRGRKWIDYVVAGKWCESRVKTMMVGRLSHHRVGDEQPGRSVSEVPLPKPQSRE